MKKERVMMMMYVSSIGSGQQLVVENHGTNTRITLNNMNPGQQQSQQSSFQSGEWVSPPTLFRTPAGIILRVETNQGQAFYQIQAQSIQALHTAPTLAGADVLSLQQATTSSTSASSMEPMKPMEPMQPMQPMKPMEPIEPMNPMAMQMGNMQMQMGGQGQGQGHRQGQGQGQGQGQSHSGKRFCTQCGNQVSSQDVFCAQCGHRLSS